ncbi:MAG: tetratricopeptide repeat protein [Leptospiraceae bacterium]|nr:tetratricopeptide repeat protein [Leptospiraceae bacterium]MCP5500681.1 tetratricopeptide repeat protein [Leptospiraceae bacterium]
MQQKKKGLIFLIFIFLFPLFSEGIEKVEKLRNQGRFKEAVHLLEKGGLISKPEDELLQARLYLDLGDSKKAEKIYEKLCSGMKSHDCWNEYGVVLLTEKKYKEARACFQNALMIQKDSQIVLSNLALSHFMMGEMKEAEEFYKLLIKASPYNPVYQTNYAIFLSKQNNEYKAKEILLTVVKENPNMFFPRMCLGMIHYKKREYNSALQQLNIAIRLNPDYYDSYYHRAVVYYKRGDYLSALDDLNRVDELYPDYPKTSELRKIIQKNVR